LVPAEPEKHQEQSEAEEAAKEAAEKLPQARIARLVEIGTVVPDVVVTDPITGGGNPALWLGLPPADGGATPPAGGATTPGAPK
jgi:hypothetical protein